MGLKEIGEALSTERPRQPLSIFRGWSLRNANCRMSFAISRITSVVCSKTASRLCGARSWVSSIKELFVASEGSRMTRRHYAHLLWDKLKETVDERLPPFIKDQ